jgi:uncharacterized protein YndB with AHSA1/START domain
MKLFSFRMTWKLRAPIGDVWRMINSAEEWPKWWRNCRNVETLRRTDAGGVGTVQRFSMQTQLPYTLQFEVTATRSEEPALLEGRVVGQLEGTVRWELSEDGNVTTLRYFWDVAPTRSWMRMLASVLRPVFVWNHRAMMRNAARGLSRMIGAELLFEEYR